MSDLNTRKILDEIGAGDSLNWVETKTGFYSGGRLYSMSNLIEFFQFPPINLIDKFRLGLTIWIASKIKDWKRLERVRVSDWLIRWSGKRVFEKIWLPLLKAKLGENYKDTSAAFIWSTIQRMYAARKSGLKKEMFGYASGGYERINEQFYTFLKDKGVDFKFNFLVDKVGRSDGDQLQIKSSERVTYNFDFVVSTLSSSQSVKIADQLTTDEKEHHGKVRYLGVICPSVLLKKPISPYYVTNITDHGAPFTGVIEMTALVDKDKELKGNNLVYLPKYVEPNDPLFEMSDEEIRNIFLASLFNMYPGITANDITYFGVARARIVFALPTLQYSVNLPGIKTSIKNYFIINSAQIINGTLNVNETIHVAESKINILLDEFRKKS